MPITWLIGYNKNEVVGYEMTRWVKVIAIQPDSLSVIPGTHGVKGLTPLHCPLASLHTYSCTSTVNKYNKFNNHSWFRYSWIYIYIVDMYVLYTYEHIYTNTQNYIFFLRSKLSLNSHSFCLTLSYSSIIDMCHMHLYEHMHT